MILLLRGQSQYIHQVGIAVFVELWWGSIDSNCFLLIFFILYIRMLLGQNYEAMCHTINSNTSIQDCMDEVWTYSVSTRLNSFWLVWRTLMPFESTQRPRHWNLLHTFSLSPPYACLWGRLVHVTANFSFRPKIFFSVLSGLFEYNYLI